MELRDCTCGSGRKTAGKEHLAREGIIEPIKPASARDVFRRFLMCASELLEDAFCPHNVYPGWQKSGLYPLDASKMLLQCPALPALSVAACKQVLAAVPKLAEIVLKSGQVTDAQVQEAVGESIVFPQDHGVN